MPAAYAHAHYIWFVFVAVALTSAFALVIFGRVVAFQDRREENAQGTAS